MECYTGGFLQFFAIKSQDSALGGWLATHYQLQAFQGFT